MASTLLYIWFLVTQSSHTRLELSLVLFLGFICTLLICRSISWVYDSRLINIFVDFFASVLPLTYLLYCESLLKRHSPLWLKLITLAASALFFVCLSINKTVNYESLIVIVFMLFLLFDQIVMSVFLLARDHKELTRAENALAGALPVTILIMTLFFLSDFKPISMLLHQQLGAIGALILIYSLIRFQEQHKNKWFVGKEMFGFVCLSVFVAALYCSVLHVRDQYLYIQITSLTFSIIILGMISNRLIFFSSRSKGLTFMKRLVQIPFESTELLNTICSTGAHADFIIIKEDELDGYDCKNISAYFYQNRGKPAKIRDLKKIVHQHYNLLNTGIDLFTQQRMDVAEQLASILEINEMTHAYALSFYPLQLLLVRIPLIRSREINELEIMLLLKIYAFISRHRRVTSDSIHLSTASNDFNST